MSMPQLSDIQRELSSRSRKIANQVKDQLEGDLSQSLRDLRFDDTTTESFNIPPFAGPPSNDIYQFGGNSSAFPRAANKWSAELRSNDLAIDMDESAKIFGGNYGSDVLNDDCSIDEITDLLDNGSMADGYGMIPVPGANIGETDEGHSQMGSFQLVLTKERKMSGSPPSQKAIIGRKRSLNDSSWISSVHSNSNDDASDKQDMMAIEHSSHLSGVYNHDDTDVMSFNTEARSSNLPFHDEVQLKSITLDFTDTIASFRNHSSGRIAGHERTTSNKESYILSPVSFGSSHSKSSDGHQRFLASQDRGDFMLGGDDDDDDDNDAGNSGPDQRFLNYKMSRIPVPGNNVPLDQDPKSIGINIDTISMVSSNHNNLGSQDSYASIAHDEYGQGTALDSHGRVTVPLGGGEDIGLTRRNISGQFSTWSPNSGPKLASYRGAPEPRSQSHSPLQGPPKYDLYDLGSGDHSSTSDNNSNDNNINHTRGCDAQYMLGDGRMSEDAVMPTMVKRASPPYQRGRQPNGGGGSANISNNGDSHGSLGAWTARRNSWGMSSLGSVEQDTPSHQIHQHAVKHPKKGLLFAAPGGQDDVEFRPVDDPDTMFGTLNGVDDPNTDEDHREVFGDVMSPNSSLSRLNDGSAGGPNSKRFHKLDSNSVTDSVIVNQKAWEGEVSNPFDRTDANNSLGLTSVGEVSGLLDTSQLSKAMPWSGHVGKRHSEDSSNQQGDGQTESRRHAPYKTPRSLGLSPHSDFRGGQNMPATPTTPTTILTRGPQSDPRKRVPGIATSFAGIDPPNHSALDKASSLSPHKEGGQHRGNATAGTPSSGSATGGRLGQKAVVSQIHPFAPVRYISSPLGKGVATPSNLKSDDSASYPEGTPSPRRESRRCNESLGLGSLINDFKDSPHPSGSGGLMGGEAEHASINSPTGSSGSWVLSRLGRGGNVSPRLTDGSDFNTSLTGQYEPFLEPTIDFDDLPKYQTLDWEVQREGSHALHQMSSPPLPTPATVEEPETVRDTRTRPTQISDFGANYLHQQQQHPSAQHLSSQHPSYVTEPTLPYTTSSSSAGNARSPALVPHNGQAHHHTNGDTILPETLLTKQKTHEVMMRRIIGGDTDAQDAGIIDPGTLSPERRLLLEKLRLLKPLMESIASGQEEGKDKVDSIIKFLSPKTDNIESFLSENKSLGLAGDAEMLAASSQLSAKRNSGWSSRVSWKSVGKITETSKAAHHVNSSYPHVADDHDRSFQSSMVYQRPSAPTPSRATRPPRPLPRLPGDYAKEDQAQGRLDSGSTYQEGVSRHHEAEWDANQATNTTPQARDSLSPRDSHHFGGAPRDQLISESLDPPPSIFEELERYEREFVQAEQSGVSTRNSKHLAPPSGPAQDLEDVSKLHAEVARFLSILNEQRDEMSKQMEELRVLSRTILESSTKTVSERANSRSARSLAEFNGQTSAQHLADNNEWEDTGGDQSEDCNGPSIANARPIHQEDKDSVQQSRIDVVKDDELRDPFMETTPASAGHVTATPHNKSLLPRTKHPNSAPPALKTRQSHSAIVAWSQLNKHTRTAEWVRTSSRLARSSTTPTRPRQPSSAGSQSGHVTSRDVEATASATTRLRHDANVWTTPSLSRSRTASSPAMDQTPKTNGDTQLHRPGTYVRDFVPLVGTARRFIVPARPHRGSQAWDERDAEDLPPGSLPLISESPTHVRKPSGNSTRSSARRRPARGVELPRDDGEIMAGPAHDAVQAGDGNNDDDSISIGSDMTITVPDPSDSGAPAMPAGNSGPAAGHRHHRYSQSTGDNTYADEFEARLCGDPQQQANTVRTTPSKRKVATPRHHARSSKSVQTTPKYHIQVEPRDEKEERDELVAQLREIIESFHRNSKDQEQAQTADAPKHSPRQCATCGNSTKTTPSRPNSAAKLGLAENNHRHRDTTTHFRHKIGDENAPFASLQLGPSDHSRYQNAYADAERELSHWLKAYIKSIESQMNTGPQMSASNVDRKEIVSAPADDARLRWEKWFNQHDPELEPYFQPPPPPYSREIRHGSDDDTLQTRGSRRVASAEAATVMSSTAAHKVIAMLKHELQVLKRRYQELTRVFEGLDPINKEQNRRRRALASELRDLVDLLDIKGEQIATLVELQLHSSKRGSLAHTGHHQGLESTTKNARLLQSAKALQDILNLSKSLESGP